jgi:hypothetical protein
MQSFTRKLWECSGGVTTPETKNSLCQESSAVLNSLNGTAVNGELLHRNMLILSLIEQRDMAKWPFPGMTTCLKKIFLFRKAPMRDGSGPRV